MKTSEYFNSGYSCSESVIMEAVEKGIVPKDILSIATPFSGGMASGCLCGAVAGAQIIIGYLFGRENKLGNNVIAREKAKQFIDAFKEEYNATCCRVLTSGLDRNDPQFAIIRKKHCSSMVDDCFNILEKTIEQQSVAY